MGLRERPRAGADLSRPGRSSTRINLCSEPAMTMTPTNLRALLIEAPVGRHFAQLHRSHDTLVESIGLYVVTGLRRGHGVIVILTPDHREALLRHAWYYDIDAEQRQRRGQLVMLDADDTLSLFMHRGMPDWHAFRRAVSGALETAARAGGGTVRAYGEMVNVLWQMGRHEAAIQLEDFWNELSRIHPFSLFCSYHLDSHDHLCYHSPLPGIGRTHTDVPPTDDDEQLRKALDLASRDVFGVALPQALAQSGHEDEPGEARLPAGQRSMLWMMRHKPEQSVHVLERARRYMGGYQPPLSA